jgi:hypothetical protein
VLRTGQPVPSSTLIPKQQRHKIPRHCTRNLRWRISRSHRSVRPRSERTRTREYAVPRRHSWQLSWPSQSSIGRVSRHPERKPISEGYCGSYRAGGERRNPRFLSAPPKFRFFFFVCPPEGGLGSSWLKHASKQRSPTKSFGFSV